MSMTNKIDTYQTEGTRIVDTELFISVEADDTGHNYPVAETLKMVAEVVHSQTNKVQDLEPGNYSVKVICVIKKL